MLEFAFVVGLVACFSLLVIFVWLFSGDNEPRGMTNEEIRESLK